jgi:hypothetical protein
MTKQDFDALPLSVRQKAKRTLRAYNSVHITFHDGEYHVSTGIMLCSEYPSAYRVVGDVNKDDVYTPDEQIVNYIESFHDYPPQYKGRRDYDMLRYMKDRRCKEAVDEKIRLVDGTARLIV